MDGLPKILLVETQIGGPQPMPATNWSILAINLGTAVGVIVAGLVVHSFVFGALKRMAAHHHRLLNGSITRHCTGPLRLIFPLLALDTVAPELKVHAAVDDLVQHLIALLLIFSVAW